MKRFAPIVVAITFCTALGCKGTPAPTKPTTAPTSRPHLMSPEFRTAAAQQAAAHPDFKVFAQKPDLPTILVVPEPTTDDQLKDLLWYLRTEVRSNHFKQLSLQPTVTVFGKPSYTSGVINIYRGPKCAREMYSTTNPCGPSIHKAASYHWGDGNNPQVDGADYVTQSGATTQVFNATDGWQTEQEARQDPDGAQAKAAAARIRFALAETTKQTKNKSDLRLYIDQPTTELTAVSYQLADEPGQKRFLNEYVFLEQEHLCALGFQSIKLATQTTPGKSYPIPCSK